MTSSTVGLLTPLVRAGGVGRYAPSPTGDLHLGNLSTALAAWEDCRTRNATFIMRIEDVDSPRNVAGAEQRILDDLRWLGIDWDEGPDVGGPAGPYRQSERDRIYLAALEALIAADLVYPCTCSRRDLQGDAAAPHGPEGPVYPGTCSARRIEQGAPLPAGASLRFRVDRDPIIRIDDEAMGAHDFDLRALCGDFVIRRRDGLWAYQFVCAVDDALMGITRVVRGADLLTSAPRQVALMRALGWAPPRYRHVPLLLDEQGNRMSKRDGSQTMALWREQGVTPHQARQRLEALRPGQR